ncbi:MAG TPA: hypothetical protein PK098_03180 [Phycisphaerales bacterium]|nr:hypothetical protein [Phycisphaerales bacterium]
MELRLGQVLVDQGVLSREQVERILEQQQNDHKPFGLLCEQLYNISPEAIEDAWAFQYAGLTRTVDPMIEVYDDAAKALVTRRQAWQFRILPIRFDDRELMLATTRLHLRRALRFATRSLGVPLYVVMAPPRSLGEALCKHYPLPGMTAESVNDDGLDRLFMPMSQAG